MPHNEVPPEYQARHDQNMAYLKEFNSGIYDLLVKHKCNSTIVTGPQGVNIGKDGGLYYKNSIKDVEAIVANFIKKPNRLLVGRPTQSDKFVEPVTGDEAWPTQAYDDRAEDFHFGRYVSEITAKLKQEQLSYGEAYTGQPFYVVTYGVGSGLQLIPLLENSKPKLLLLADLDQDGLYMSTFFIDWQKLTEIAKASDTTIRFVINKDAARLHEAIRGTIMTHSLLGLDGLQPYIDNDVPQLRKIYYELLDPKSGNMANFIGFITDEYNMMKNSFRNLKHGDKRIIVGAKVKLDKPVLVVASGPSLEDNIEHIKRLQDRWVIISSGSSMKVLLSHGIKPDFHCNLERAKSIYERHAEMVTEGFDMKEIYAVMTTTIWPGVDSFFKDTIYFLRPALSPLGMFCDSLDQVLYNEGPQVANTAFAFARRLAAKQIYLLGVDLGTSDPARPRAVGAWQGIRPRKLGIPIRGNSGKTVFTDMQLIQQRDTLESQIRKLNEVGGFCKNLGHGAKLTGSPAAKIQELELPEWPVPKADIVKELAEQFPVYSRQKFESNWTSSVVRESVARFVKHFNKIMDHPGWTNSMILDLENLCQYVNKPLREQYPPRLIRGSLLRILMHSHGIIQRAANEEDRAKLIEIAKATILENLNRIEMEAYGLADELETEDEILANQ